MAGRAKRSEAKKRRRSEKRARKAAQKAKYELWKSLGQNTKSKRVKLRIKALRRRKLRTLRHADGPCGNIGCGKCNPLPQAA
jgi:hypothetical protein